MNSPFIKFHITKLVEEILDFILRTIIVGKFGRIKHFGIGYHSNNTNAILVILNILNYFKPRNRYEI